jgi:uncharacterized membrane protein YdbT with pleckstrin-like domain
MSYVSSIVQPGENILATGRLHWIIYKDAAVCVLLSIILFLVASNPNYSENTAVLASGAAFFLLAAAILLAIKAWFDQWITEIAVTNLRVIYKRGFISRHTAEMNMDKIESVTVTQSILGRMLDYGTIDIRGTGVGIEHLHQIATPVALRNSITAR